MGSEMCIRDRSRRVHRDGPRAGGRGSPRLSGAVTPRGQGRSPRDTARRLSPPSTGTADGRLRRRDGHRTLVARTAAAGSIRGARERGQTDADLWKKPSRTSRRRQASAELSPGTAAVSAPSCASQALGSFAIRSADEPVVAVHHRVDEEHLPLDGARQRDLPRRAVRGVSRYPQASGRDCRSGAQAEEVPAFASRLTPAGGGG